MDLLNKIGNKVSNVGEGMTTQTKNLTEIAKLNLEISANEKSIGELYTVIGRMYYEQSDTMELDIAREQVEQVNLLVRSNQNLRDTLKTIKGMIICTGCGHEISSKSMFCNYCGTPVEKEIKANTSLNMCKKCGNNLEEGDLFCVNCGEGVDVKLEEPVEEMRELTCPQCATVLTEGTKFCVKCGTRIRIE